MNTEETLLREVRIPRLNASSWTVDSANGALVYLQQVQCQMDAARAVLVGVVPAETGRDTKASLCRHLKMSSAEAAKAVAVAEVLKRLPDAEALLAEGQLTADQVHRLAVVRDDESAGELLRSGAENGDSAAEFARRVQQHRITSEGPSFRQRQRASRGVWFSTTDNGCVGVRAVLPPVQGAQFKAALDQLVDERYRAAHPELAKKVGGHEEDPRCRRLADALVDIVTGQDAVNPRDAVNGRDGMAGRDGVAGQGATGRAVAVRPERRGRTAVIVTINAHTFQAEILGQGPVPIRDALDLIGQARVDLYAVLQDVKGEILNFGRSKRIATEIQHFALAIRHGGVCIEPGCTVPWTQCDADHVAAWKDGGRTDLNNLAPRCTHLHHPHKHASEHRNPTEFEQGWKQKTSPPKAA